MSIVTSLELLPLIGTVLLTFLPKGNADMVKKFAFIISLVVLGVAGVMAYKFKTNMPGMQFVESKVCFRSVYKQFLSPGQNSKKLSKR